MLSYGLPADQARNSSACSWALSCGWMCRNEKEKLVICEVFFPATESGGEVAGTAWLRIPACLFLEEQPHARKHRGQSFSCWQSSVWVELHLLISVRPTAKDLGAQEGKSHRATFDLFVSMELCRCTHEPQSPVPLGNLWTNRACVGSGRVNPPAAPRES